MRLLLLFRDFRVAFVRKVYQDRVHRDKYQRGTTVPLAAFRVVCHLELVRRHVLLLLVPTLLRVPLRLLLRDVFFRASHLAVGKRSLTEGRSCPAKVTALITGVITATLACAERRSPVSDGSVIACTTSTWYDFVARTFRSRIIHDRV